MTHFYTTGQGPKKPYKGRHQGQHQGRYEPLLVPALDAFDMIGVGVTQMLDVGKLASVMIGRRRYVTTESLRRVASGATQEDQQDDTYADLNKRIASELAEMSRDEAVDAVRALGVYAKAVTYYAQMKWPDFNADDTAAEPASEPAE